MNLELQKRPPILNVVHFQRRPQPTQFSMEGYFERIRECLEALPKADDHSCGNVDIRVHVHTMPCYSKGLVGRLKNIWSAFRHQGDVNHITGDVQYIALLLRKKRTMMTVHDCQILERLTGWRRSLVKCLWYTLPAKCVAAMTSNSEETKRQLLKVVRFPPEKIHVIPISVSPLFRPMSRLFNAECPRILQVGTKSNKNLPRLIQALQGMKCHLEIVGPVDDSLRQCLNDHQIAFTQFGRLTTEEIVERYQQADVVSFVSTHEGFGIPIVEAQSVERVCVTSNCSSMPEVAGSGACLVDPFDVDSIRTGFQRVINDADYRERLIEAGRSNRMRFNDALLAEKYAALYRELSKGAGS